MREWQEVWLSHPYADPAVRNARAAYKFGLLSQMGLALSERSKVLDVGCGDGALARLIAVSTGAHVTGIDASLTAVRRAELLNSHPRVIFSQRRIGLDGCGDASDLGHFDLVVFAGVLEHTPDPFEVLMDATASLSAGGGLGVVWSHTRSLFSLERFVRQLVGLWPYGLQREISKDDLHRLLHRAGLIDVAVRVASSDPAARSRLLGWIDARLHAQIGTVGRYIVSLARKPAP